MIQIKRDMRRREVLKSVGSASAGAAIAASSVEVVAANDADRIQSTRVNFGVLAIGLAEQPPPSPRLCRTTSWPFYETNSHRDRLDPTFDQIFVPIDRRLDHLRDDPDILFATDGGFRTRKRGSVSLAVLPEKTSRIGRGDVFATRIGRIDYEIDSHDLYVSVAGNEFIAGSGSVRKETVEIETEGEGDLVDIEVAVSNFGDCQVFSHPEYQLIPKRKDTERFAKAQNEHQTSNRGNEPGIIAHEYTDPESYGIEVRR